MKLFTVDYSFIEKYYNTNHNHKFLWSWFLFFLFYFLTVLLCITCVMLLYFMSFILSFFVFYFRSLRSEEQENSSYQLYYYLITDRLLPTACKHTANRCLRSPINTDSFIFIDVQIYTGDYLYSLFYFSLTIVRLNL